MGTDVNGLVCHRVALADYRMGYLNVPHYTRLALWGIAVPIAVFIGYLIGLWVA